MFGGAFWRGGRGGGGPLSLNPLPAPVSAEGITDTEMLIFDGRVAKYGPGQKESFCPIPGNNSIFAGRRFVCTRSDFLNLRSFFFQIVVPDSARHGSKVLEGLSNIEVPEFKELKELKMTHPRKWRRPRSPEPPIHTRRGSR